MEAGVKRPRINVVRQADLFDSSESLKIRMFDEVEQNIVGDGEEPVNGVVENFFLIHALYAGCVLLAGHLNYGKLFGQRCGNILPPVQSSLGKTVIGSEICCRYRGLHLVDRFVEPPLKTVNLLAGFTLLANIFPL
jgi:hypothetical protein